MQICYFILKYFHMHYCHSSGCYNKIMITGCLKQWKYTSFFSVLEAWSPGSWCQIGWTLVKALFLACRWPSSCWVHLGSEIVKFSDLSSWKGTNTIIRLPMTSFKPHYLPKAPSPNTITVGIRTPMWGHTVSP